MGCIFASPRAQETRYEERIIGQPTIYCGDQYAALSSRYPRSMPNIGHSPWMMRYTTDYHLHPNNKYKFGLRPVTTEYPRELRNFRQFRVQNVSDYNQHQHYRHKGYNSYTDDERSIPINQIATRNVQHTEETSYFTESFNPDTNTINCRFRWSAKSIATSTTEFHTGSRSGISHSESFFDSDVQFDSQRPKDPDTDYPVSDSSDDIEPSSMFEDLTNKEEQGKGMAGVLFTREEVLQTKFRILDPNQFLPRYRYHRFLQDGFRERIQNIPAFQELSFRDCSVFTGGHIEKEKNLSIFGEKALKEEIDVNALSRDTSGNDKLLIYFVDVADERRNILDDLELSGFKALRNGTVLFVVKNDKERWRHEITEASKKLGVTKLEFVKESRFDIINKMTCILEKRISADLENIKDKLIQCSHFQNVDSSMLEVNAILKRLRQAENYPNLGALEEEENVEKTETEEIDVVLRRYGEKILYHGFDGFKHFVITTDADVKEALEMSFSMIRNGRINFVIIVESEVSVSALTRRGAPLHGAKFVHLNNGVDAFEADPNYATTGSLMMSNRKSMVVVTCRHALEEHENNPIYVLIDNLVRELGKQVQQVQNNMERLHDDISLIQVDENTRQLVDSTCEKLLIDCFGNPTPAQISLRSLEKGDIVHKRGATTKLTTGFVSDVKTTRIGRFQIASPVAFINGRHHGNFADYGDSGSLVFQHSLSPDENMLDVFAVVQSVVNLPMLTREIVCFPFDKGCETLYRNIPSLRSLQFFDK